MRPWSNPGVGTFFLKGPEDRHLRLCSLRGKINVLQVLTSAFKCNRLRFHVLPFLHFTSLSLSWWASGPPERVLSPRRGHQAVSGDSSAGHGWDGGHCFTHSRVPGTETAAPKLSSAKVGGLCPGPVWVHGLRGRFAGSSAQRWPRS